MAHRLRNADLASLRTYIDACLVTDADLDAFIIDYFPAIAKRLSGAMERTQKVNLLFLSIDAQLIYEKLMCAKHGLIFNYSQGEQRVSSLLRTELFDSGIQELVALLEYRLMRFYQRISIQILSLEEQAEARRLVGDLGELHGEYEKSLRSGHLVLAHEICMDMTKLVERIERRLAVPRYHRRAMFMPGQLGCQLAMAA